MINNLVSHIFIGICDNMLLNWDLPHKLIAVLETKSYAGVAMLIILWKLYSENVVLCN